MKKQRLYRKLAAAHQFGVATGGWVSLHLAADHLLLRSSAGFIERYHRFYFRDVEAITIAHTIRGHVWSVLFGAGMLFSSLPMLINWSPHPVAIAFVGFFALLLLVNVARGPTCVTRLQTRVQTRKLPLRRARKAMRIVKKIAPLIETAQAELATSPAAGTPERRTISAAATELPAEPPPLPDERAPAAPWSHLVAAVVLAFSGVLVFFSAMQPESAGLAYGSYAAAMVNLGLALTALVQQRRRRTPALVLPLPWIAVVAHMLTMPVVYFVFNIMLSMQSARTEQPAFGEMPIGELRPLPGFTEVLWGYSGFALLLGLVWLVLFLISRTRASR